MELDVSVALIFKNEIRCLERMLQSLQPLKERVACEIVAADTGSDDGSRAIAEKYVDVLFDFPWINDFSAARNAVLERCSGRWVFVMDADSWLDDDIDEMVAFLTGAVRFRGKNLAMVCIRNYLESDFRHYSDGYSMAIFLNANRPRYRNAVHEVPYFANGEAMRMVTLQNTIVHHDGYVMLNDGSEDGKRKVERNLMLMRGILAQDPNNLRSLSEYLDIGSGEDDEPEIMRRTVELVKANKFHEYAPSALNNAARAALQRDMIDEAIEWGELMLNTYPTSWLARVDANYTLLKACHDKGEWEKEMSYGEDYLKAAEAFNDRRNNKDTLSAVGSVRQASIPFITDTRIILANTMKEQGEYARAYQVLRGIHFKSLDVPRAIATFRKLLEVRLSCDLDFAPLISAFWDGISTDAEGADTAKARQEAFLLMGRGIFEARELTDGKGTLSSDADKIRDLFLPLKGRCPLGDAAALMHAETAEEAGRLLKRAGGLDMCPASALLKALTLLGGSFPEEPMPVERMDAVARRLMAWPEELEDLAVQTAKELKAGAPWQRVLWARGLTLAAVSCVNWEAGEHMELVYAFADIEGEYLDRCYTVEALDELNALPPMHRFAWLLLQALEAWERGEAADCVRTLRRALESNTDAKRMTGYILGALQAELEERRRAATPELLALAEKVRSAMAAFSPDAPELAELKRSPAYRKVAFLIEADIDPERFSVSELSDTEE